MTKKYKKILIVLMLTAIIAVGLSYYLPKTDRQDCLKKYPATTDIVSFDEIILEIPYDGGYWRPKFRLTINGDGSVYFQGPDYPHGKFVYKEKSPDKSAKLSKEQMKELISELNRSAYFSIPDKYDQRKRETCFNIWSSSVSTTKTSVRIGSRHHSITRDSAPNSPAQLRAFEDAIYKIVNIEQWLGASAYKDLTVVR